MGIPADAEITSFYRAGVLGLRALDAIAPRARRFGADADATWHAFQGELAPADRIDLLLRDGAVAHPAAFAPRVVFALPGLAADEPFGPDWPGASAAQAAALLREGGASPAGLDGALRAAVAAWALPAGGAPLLPVLRPQSRFVAAGAPAIVALALAFQGRAELDLPDQVLLVTDHPGERQLFGLAAALLGSASPVRALPSSATVDDARARGLGRVDQAIVAAGAAAATAAHTLSARLA